MLRRTPPNPPPDLVRQVADGPHTLLVTVRRDSRLRSSVRWTVEHQTIVVRVPLQLSDRELESALDKIVAGVLRQRARARTQSDDALEARARALNQRYFGGELTWHTIRWVTTMQHRLGSCTNGGSTDGDIRISARIRGWPAYVVDYVIAHELAHRKHPNHSAEFWAYLACYPHTERARGFIEGFAFAQGQPPDDLL